MKKEKKEKKEKKKRIEMGVAENLLCVEIKVIGKDKRKVKL